MQDEGILRGEIYYVAIPYATGHEMEKDRPAIVVSCEELNRTSPCVAVVMCICEIMEWAEEAGVDMEMVLDIKHEYNKTRPYRHGGKAL